MAVAALAASTGSAAAQMACGSHDKIVDTLDRSYKETLTNFGIAGQRNLLEVFASEKGTWTIIVTTPEGMTCIMAAGQSWENVPPSKKLTGL
jgi:hypothetical protein